MDILDVVLFDELSAGEQESATSSSLASTSFAGMRWLFTAKNGRVMKKSTHNTNLGALKQALLARAILRRASSAGENRRHSSSATGGGAFATALLGSGESVPLDEDAWTALVVLEGGREGGAVAVTALAPAGGDRDMEAPRRGGPTLQRFACEYRVKLDNRSTALARADPVAATDFAVTAKPIEASMATYVLVTRGLLRDENGREKEPQNDQAKQTPRGEAGEMATSATAALVDERLLSRAKTTNLEIEAKLRAVVQWVQEARSVYVLSMAATFTVVPSSGKSAGKPGVWLEQALHVRMVPKNGSAPAPAPAPAAPIAEPPGITPIDRQDPVPVCSGAKLSGHEGNGTLCQPSTANSAEDIVPTAVPSASDVGGAVTPPQSPPLPSLPMTRASAFVDKLSGTKVQLESTTEMLSAAADAVLSAGKNFQASTAQTRPLQAADGVIVDAAQLQQGSVGDARGNRQRPLAANTYRQRGRHSTADARSDAMAACPLPFASTAGVLPRARVKCSGDFCAYCRSGGEEPESPAGSPPKGSPPKEAPLGENISRVGASSEAGNRKGKAAAGVDWTDISMSGDKSGAALLEVGKKRRDLPSPVDSEPGKGKEMLFSLTFKSIGLARVEAKQGRDAYWGEDLRRCWREGSCRAVGSLEELSPALIYQQVAVCRACYEVYRRLDNLRGKSDRTAGGGDTRASSSTLLPLPFPAPSKGRQELLASIDATAASGRRAAAAEAGAVALRAEVAEMLKDVDVRTGKLGIEAGIIWRRRLSKSKSSVGAGVSSGISQARLMGKLAQPKQLSPDGEQRTDPAHAARSARRPSLKRRVKSQGDIPEPGFPLLPRRRRTGPASASIGRSVEERKAAGAPRRTLPPGVPRRSAWPLLHDDGGMDTRQYSGDTEKLHGGGGGEGGSGMRSTATICAIEAMLEEGGGESYLPANVRDLPEAAAVLGLPRPGLSDDKQGCASRQEHPRGTTKKAKGSRHGDDRNNPRRLENQAAESSTNSFDARSENRVAGGNPNDLEPNTNDGRTGRTAAGASTRARRCDGAEERFLHPWQRALEASKRAIKSRAEEHESALSKEKRRRSDARRAAAASKDCQKARKRVAARLGRLKQRPRRRRSVKNGDHAEQDKQQLPQSGFGRKSTPLNTEEHGGGSRGNLDRKVYPCRQTRQWQPGDYGGGSGERDDYLHQMHDVLGWARKTLMALVQRLRDMGVAVDNNLAAAAAATRAPVDSCSAERTAKDWEVVRVANKLHRRLAAFEDESVNFGVECAAAAAAAAAKGPAAADTNSTLPLLQSRCEAACESFENEFGHMIDELIATARTHPSNPNPPQLSHFEGDDDGGRPLIATGPENRQQHASDSGDERQSADLRLTASAATRPGEAVGTATFGLCPSCSLLPVARRCLDCEGDHGDRSRCSSCFVREHREAPRHLHRFLRISGGGGVGGCGGDGSGDGGDHREPKQHLGGAQGDDSARAGNSETPGNSSGVGVRCSRCGDLAAARRCRECCVDTCAACHFLAHRSPSRQSHVTEYVGETAVALQEALHSRSRHRTVEASRVTASEARRSGDREYEGPRGEGGAGEGTLGPATFSKDAAQSLAKVRKTVDAPVVRPRSQASREWGSLSRGRDDGAVGVVGCSEEEELPDEADSDGTRYEEGLSHSSGSRGGDRVDGPLDNNSIYDGRDSVGTFGIGGRIQAAGNNGSDSSVRDDQKGRGDHVERRSNVTGDIVRGEGDAVVVPSFNDSLKDGDDRGRLEGRGYRDTDRLQGGRGVDGVKYALGVLEEINEEEEEGEDEEDDEETSAGSSIYSSSREDTDDEGMMWSPANIAKVGVEEEEEPSPPLPPQEATPTEVAETVAGTGEACGAESDRSRLSLEGGTPKRGVANAERVEETGDASGDTNHNHCLERREGRQDHALVQLASPATLETITEGVVAKAVNEADGSLPVPFQDAASKSETEERDGVETLNGHIETNGKHADSSGIYETAEE